MKVEHLLSVAFVAGILVFGARAAEEKAPVDHSKPAAGTPHKYKSVDAATFDQMRKTDKDAVVLDVRTKKEYQEGHIPGSVLIDFNSPDFGKEIAKLDKNKTYLVHCASGGRSARACGKMEKMDFSKLYNLQGGMGAWEKAGKPVEK
jgi:rhodanese-related sulfurtransferase